MIALMGWKGYVAAASAGALVGGLAACSVQQLRVQARDADLRAERAMIGQLRHDNAQCSTDIQAAAAGWVEYRRQATEREARAKAAQVAAESRARAADAKAAELARRPSASADQCAAVADLLGEYLEGKR
ncbi:hypothetical protein FOZ76_11705 [Verticiella sediminum]|uniref:Uncharacterized protein n=1 Tax=Verticiella sediminum TaxID=1247510 RepID=A0A556API7_9BURK|nr:hypothetical protein [Verticiella sediminum]TSH94802.1 hypothetical protein FOZ76_11705 [Verticiella sediminum]